MTILIIGAGFAGLAAARTLQSAGKAFQILEARTRLGGRTHTDHRLGCALDQGAAWIHGPILNPLSDLTVEFGVETGFTDFNNDNGDSLLALDEYGEPYEMDDYTLGRLLYDSALQYSYRSLLFPPSAQPRSLAEVTSGKLPGVHLEACSPSTRAGFEFMAQIRAQLIDNEDPQKIDYHTTQDYHQLDGGDLILAPGGGYAAIYNQLAKPFQTAGKIKLGVEVQAIAYDSNGVRVTTNQGEFSAEQVIITVPLGVLKSGKIAFSPALPAEKQTAIQQIGFGLYEKLFLKFDHVFWTPQAHLINFHTPSTMPFFQSWLNMSEYTGQPIIACQHGGSRARALNKLDDQAVLAEAMKALRIMFGNHIPDPLAYVRTAWEADPYALGSYSYQGLGQSPSARAQLRANIAQRLFFAGEACHPHYFGTVHGAWETGIRAAQDCLAND